MKNFKQTMAACLLIVLGYTGSVFAHTQAGALGSALSGKAATDVIVVSCTKGTDIPGHPIVVPTRLRFHVKDMLPVKSPLVSIQAMKGTKSSALYIDRKDGDVTYTPWVDLVAGAGNYTMKVNKSASTLKGVEAYLAEFHCWDAKGRHSGIKWKVVQNQ